MKFEVGDKVRLTKAWQAWSERDINDDSRLSVGDTGVVVEVEPEDDLAYLVKMDNADVPKRWYREVVLELVTNVSTQPSLSTPFRKVVTLTSPGFDFTLDSEGNFTFRDTDDDDGISLPFATLVAAVDELRKEAK